MYQTFKEKNDTSIKKQGEGDLFFNLFYEVNIILILKPDRSQKKYRPTPHEHRHKNL